MKVNIIHEHAICLDELREGANILDLGCRGFQFTAYFDKRGDYVLPVDIDPNLGGERPYLNLAISNYNGICGIKRNGDPQATKMSRTIGDEKVECVTMDRLHEITTVEYFDLVKVDIEGAEWELIMSLTKPPAKQITWEGHLHTGAYGMNEFAMMEAKLSSLGYTRIYQDYSRKHGLPENFWSNLWIKK